MSPAAVHGDLERVIVAIDEASSAAAAVDVAVRLAAALDARLTALFLQNADLVRAAALPFLRETGRMSGIARPMAGPALVRMLRTHAEQARNAVAAAAEGTGLEWRFEIVHGRRSALLSTPRDTLDFLVLPQAVVDAIPEVPMPFRALERTVDRRPIAVTVRDVPGAERALRAARALARTCDAPLLLLLCERGSARDGRLRELIHRLLGTSPRRVEYMTLHEDSDTAIAAAARQHGARLLVCCDGGLRHDAQRVDSLLGRVRCPVVVAD